MRATALVLAILAAGCPTGGAAKAVRSEPPKLTDAKGERPATPPAQAPACAPGQSHDTLVVDWDPELRGDLEVAMKQGVAVVAFDCSSIKLLGDCTLEGSYGFIGMTRKEKVVSLKDADEVKANLPLGGLKIAVELDAGLQRDTSLDIAMVMIGKRSTARKQAGPGDLTGSCDGATHFVRGATLGAFVMSAGAKSEAKTVAGLFGKGASAGSSSAESVNQKDGDLSECQKASPDAAAPPAQCGAVLRLQLASLAPAAAPPAAVESPACGEGFVQTDGLCVVATDDPPHQCKAGDAADCAAQCEREHAGSCHALAALYRAGAGVDTDWGKAAELDAKACAGGHLPACTAAAAAHAAGEGVPRDRARALALYEQACGGGEALACVDLGAMLLDTRGKAKAEAGERAMTLFRRACYGGEYEGCAQVGLMYAQGRGGVDKNPAIAAKFLDKACREGSLAGCAALAEQLRAGAGVAKDEARANELFDKACRGGYAEACKKKR